MVFSYIVSLSLVLILFNNVVINFTTFIFDNNTWKSYLTIILRLLPANSQNFGFYKFTTCIFNVCIIYLVLIWSILWLCIIFTLLRTNFVVGIDRVHKKKFLFISPISLKLSIFVISLFYATNSAFPPCVLTILTVVSILFHRLWKTH